MNGHALWGFWGKEEMFWASSLGRVTGRGENWAGLVGCGEFP